MKKLLSILVFLCCILFVGKIKSEIRDSDIQKRLYSSNIANKDSVKIVQDTLEERLKDMKNSVRETYLLDYSVIYLTPQPEFQGEKPRSFIKWVYENLEYPDDAKKNDI